MSDDDPPASGAAAVVNEESEQIEISLAPTAEPKHKVKPARAITA